MQPTSKDDKRIGDYLVGKTIGTGSFSKVKLGTHVTSGQKVSLSFDLVLEVALKLIEHTLISSEKQKQNIDREIKILKVLTHKNIVRLHDVIELPEEKVTCLVLEYVGGGELFDYIVGRGRLTIPEAANFLCQILSALEYCHSSRVIHRDLKPENLLMDDNKNIKINDFGLSNIMTSGAFLTTSCGSPHYSSPEILKKQEYIGPEVDIWSLGVILYAMVTGCLPWEGSDLKTQLENAINGKFKFPTIVPPDCADLISRMLTIDPRKRATIEEIRHHEFLTKYFGVIPSCLPERKFTGKLDQTIVDYLVDLGFTQTEIEKAISEDIKTSQIHHLYFLMLDHKEKEQLKISKVVETSSPIDITSSTSSEKSKGSSSPSMNTSTLKSREISPKNSSSKSLVGLFFSRFGDKSKKEKRPNSHEVPNVIEKPKWRMSNPNSKNEVLEPASEDMLRVLKPSGSGLDPATASTRPIHEIQQEMIRVLGLLKVEFKPNKTNNVFVCRDRTTAVKFEIEVFKFDKVSTLKGLKFRRVKGDTMAFKKLHDKFRNEVQM